MTILLLYVQESLSLNKVQHSHFYKRMYNYLLIQCHLCPIRSPVLPLNLTYISLFLDTIFEKPDLYRLLKFQIPNLMPNVRWLEHFKEPIQACGPKQHFATWHFYGRELLAHSSTCELEGQPCWLFATVYSIYSQLPSALERITYPKISDKE